MLSLRIMHKNLRNFMFNYLLVWRIIIFFFSFFFFFHSLSMFFVHRMLSASCARILHSNVNCCLFPSFSYLSFWLNGFSSLSICSSLFLYLPTHFICCLIFNSAENSTTNQTCLRTLLFSVWPGTPGHRERKREREREREMLSFYLLDEASGWCNVHSNDLNE